MRISAYQDHLKQVGELSMSRVFDTPHQFISPLRGVSYNNPAQLLILVHYGRDIDHWLDHFSMAVSEPYPSYHSVLRCIKYCILTCELTFLAPPTIKAARKSVNLAIAVIILTHCAASSRVGARTNARVAASELCFFLAFIPPIVVRPPPRCNIRSMTGNKKAAVLPPD